MVLKWGNVILRRIFDIRASGNVILRHVFDIGYLRNVSLQCISTSVPPEMSFNNVFLAFVICSFRFRNNFEGVREMAKKM